MIICFGLKYAFERLQNELVRKILSDLEGTSTNIKIDILYIEVSKNMKKKIRAKKKRNY